MYERLLEIREKGFELTLIISKSQSQCNISLDSRLNYTFHCDNDPRLALEEAWKRAQELKPVEKPDFNIDSILADLDLTHNID